MYLELIVNSFNTYETVCILVLLVNIKVNKWIDNVNSLLFRKSQIRFSVGATPTQDINVLRDRAKASEFSSVDLDTILMERKRELSFEGIAMFDAKRLKRSVGEIPYNANRLVLSVPLRECQSKFRTESKI